MGDEQQHALEFLNGGLHPLPGRNVQMVGRLVENQQVDFLVHEHTQSQPGLLAAGEIAHLLEHIFPLKEELAQPVPGHLGRAVLLVEHGVVKAPLRVVKVNDLGQIAPFHRGAELDFALAVLLPQQAFEKGGLSSAVVAQNRNPFAPLHPEVHVGKQHPVTEGLGHILHGKHHVALKALFPEAGLHGPLLGGALGLFDPVHPMLDGHGPAVQRPVVDAPALHPLHGIAQLLQLGLLLLVLL